VVGRRPEDDGVGPPDLGGEGDGVADLVVVRVVDRKVPLPQVEQLRRRAGGVGGSQRPRHRLPGVAPVAQAARDADHVWLLGHGRA
jgi:hypothetical protein